MKILTFDVEEWFHLLDHNCTRSPDGWAGFEIRIHKNMERILEVLERRNLKATFFCLGWIAERYPEVIRQIAELGHEIGSHTQFHQLAYEQSPQEFAEDVGRSVKVLQDVTGGPIRCFRAPGFSIGEKNKWAFEILANLGIEIDSSIFPARRAHGGFQTFPAPVPSLVRFQGCEIKEFPISFVKMAGRPLVFSGGGYFRLAPYWVISALTRRSKYVMSYFHPRDFDPVQPMVPGLSASRRFKAYIGLNQAAGKLERWLGDFEFTDLATADASIDWQRVPVVQL